MDHRIRVPQVRVIGPEGEQLGILDTRDAQRRAQALGLNLVEVSPNAEPPVCKIIDYGKYKYEQAKLARDSKKNRTAQELKEVKFRPQIGDHDFTFKAKHTRDFLEEGHRVKLLVQFRGRQMVHPETGQAILDRVCRELSDVCSVVQASRMDGRNMSMTLGPRSQKGTRQEAAS
jgi:translation initiation factor IF-3